MTVLSPTGKPPAGAQILDRAVEVLAALAQAPAPLRPGELAERCSVPASTTYRLLADLEHHGLVAREPRRGVTLGLRVLELARSVEERLEAALVRPAREVMEALAREHGETAILTAPAGAHAICVHSVESPAHAMRLSYERWRVAPIHLGASGKVLLAHLDDTAVERVLAAPAPHPARGSGVDPDTLRGQLDAVRRDGRVVTSDELDEGATAVAAPVLDARGRVVAGLSVAGPTERMRRALDRIAPAVVAGARAIEARLDAAATDAPGADAR